VPRNDQSPYFYFFPDVEAMTTEEVGAYMLLICKSWREEPVASIPDDDRILARWSRLSPDRWSECRASVLAAFKLGKDGRWHQKRLRLEYDKLRRIQKNRSESGKLGAEVRYGKSRIDNNIDSSAIAAPKQSQGFAIAALSHTSIKECSSVSCSSEFSLEPESVEVKKVARNGNHNVKQMSELDLCIERVAGEICSRHPKERTIGQAEARRLLHAIAGRVVYAKRLERIELVNRNHEGWCTSLDWQKDEGHYAKGLANWLAPTMERYLQEPPTLEDSVYLPPRTMEGQW
jgi:uncharacterized protein YdaU (DUF1376 family)